MEENEGKVNVSDVYSGEIITCWHDDDFVFVSFPWCTINFPVEDFDNVIEELDELIKEWRKRDEDVFNKIINAN